MPSRLHNFQPPGACLYAFDRRTRVSYSIISRNKTPCVIFCYDFSSQRYDYSHKALAQNQLLREIRYKAAVCASLNKRDVW